MFCRPGLDSLQFPSHHCFLDFHRNHLVKPSSKMIISLPTLPSLATSWMASWGSCGGLLSTDLDSESVFLWYLCVSWSLFHLYCFSRVWGRTSLLPRLAILFGCVSSTPAFQVILSSLFFTGMCMNSTCLYSREYICVIKIKSCSFFRCLCNISSRNTQRLWSRSLSSKLWFVLHTLHHPLSCRGKLSE